MNELKVGDIVQHEGTKGVVVDIRKSDDNVHAEVDFNGKTLTLPQHSLYNPVDLCVNDTEVFSGEEQDLECVPSNYVMFVKRTTAGSLSTGDLVILQDKTITAVKSIIKPRCPSRFMPDAVITVNVDHESEEFSCPCSTPVYVLAVERKRLKKC